MAKSKSISIQLAIASALLIVSGSIALPILWRPFYFWQVKKLHIVEYSGYSLEVIKEAYNQMMDFCCGLSKTFGTGQLAFSNEGMLHFVDCRKLFLLDFAILAISLIWFIYLQIIKKKKGAAKLNGHTPYYYGSVSILSFFVMIGFLASIDFDKAFVMFHKIFFPGKTNWIFSTTKDQIINILPEEFFMNCAILIGALIIFTSFGLILYDYLDNHGYLVKTK